MLTRRTCLGLAGVATLAVAGCSFNTFTYTTERYGTAASSNITLRCRDTYEVVDRPDAGTLLVITNGVNEVLAGCLDRGPPLAERQRQVAQIFLEEKTRRPQCRIVGDAQLTLLHREFTYQCAAPGDAGPGAGPSRRT